MSDNVNPSHYKDFKVTPVDLIEAYQMDFNSGNVIKCTARAPHKNKHEDLRKALWYLLRLVGFPKQRIEEITTEAKEYGNS